MYFIPEWTEQIHHISYDDVRDKPYFPEVWDTIITPFINENLELPFVAHNACFDMNVSGTLLRNEVKQMRGATGLTVFALILTCVAALRCYLF